MDRASMTGFGYCERLSGAFWAEPLNALSNGAFILAALAAWLLQRRHGIRDPAIAALTGLVFAIGLGSFLFHTIPQRWTLMADVIPIQFFAFSYFGFALRRFLGLGLLASSIGTLVFLAATFGTLAAIGPLLPPVLRGSAGYASFLLALLGVALAIWRREAGGPVAGLIGSAGVFALSLTLRTLDGPLCHAVPLGLHVFWHLLNAAVLYLLLRAAIVARRAS